MDLNPPPKTRITSRPVISMLEIRNKNKNETEGDLLVTLNPLSTTKLEITSHNPAVLDSIVHHIEHRNSLPDSVLPKSQKIDVSRQDGDTLILQGNMAGISVAVARAQHPDGSAINDHLVTADWAALDDAIVAELLNRFADGVKENRLPTSDEISNLEKVLASGAKGPGQREIKTSNLPG